MPNNKDFSNMIINLSIFKKKWSVGCSSALLLTNSINERCQSFFLPNLKVLKCWLHYAPYIAENHSIPWWIHKKQMMTVSVRIPWEAAMSENLSRLLSPSVFWRTTRLQILGSDSRTAGHVWKPETLTRTINITYIRQRGWGGTDALKCWIIIAIPLQWWQNLK